MFILIDIPEDVYKRCKEYQLFCGEAEILEAAVARGILPESSGDYISRTAVLSKIQEVCFDEDWVAFRINNGSNGQRDYIINYIENLPSFEVWNGKIELHPTPEQVNKIKEAYNETESYSCIKNDKFNIRR